MQHWVLLVVVGLSCLSFSAFTAYRLFQLLSFGRGHIYVQIIAPPLLPAAIGLAALWQALHVTDILVVRVGPRRLVFPLDTLKGGQRPLALKSYLAKRIRF